ncbi:MAG: DUF4760 domain-containing protein [Acidobacteriota bacterium]
MQTPNLADWMQAWGSVATAGISFLLLLQLAILWRQLRSASQWNKLNAAFTYFSTDVIMDRERAANEALGICDFDLVNSDNALTEAQLLTLKKDKDAYQEVKNFLNIIEDYSTAVHLGAIDEEAAYNMISVLLTRWVKLLRTFIDDRRVMLGNERIYGELERLCQVWACKMDEEDQESAAKMEQVKSEARRGAPRKV